jgi:hypothetical protein
MPDGDLLFGLSDTAIYVPSIAAQSAAEKIIIVCRNAHA